MILLFNIDINIAFYLIRIVIMKKARIKTKNIWKSINQRTWEIKKKKYNHESSLQTICVHIFLTCKVNFTMVYTLITFEGYKVVPCMCNKCNKSPSSYWKVYMHYYKVLLTKCPWFLLFLCALKPKQFMFTEWSVKYGKEFWAVKLNCSPINYYTNCTVKIWPTFSF